MEFEDIIGNEKIKALLTNAIKSNNILHSYLFTGINGIGKSLFAKEFAHMILCSSNAAKPCNICKSCLEFNARSHPDFLQVDAEDGKTIKIEQIRYLQEKIAEKPVTSDKKVYIINDADCMTREASNSLLKTLEEPPIYSIIILVTNNESKLLTTIKSRCTKINFEPLSNENIKLYINKVINNTEKYTKNITENMIKQSQGSIGKFLKLVEDQEEYLQVEEVISNIEKDDITKIWLKSDILYKSKEKILDLLDYINLVFYQKLKENQDMRCIKAISIVEEAKKRITSNSNYDMTIDNLLLKLWEEFC